MRNYFWIFIILFLLSSCKNMDNTNKISFPKNKDFGINLKTKSPGLEIKN